MQKLSAGKFHFEPPFTSLNHLVGERKQRGRNSHLTYPLGLWVVGGVPGARE
jgi:hypothetical protein